MVIDQCFRENCLIFLTLNQNHNLCNEFYFVGLVLSFVFVWKQMYSLLTGLSTLVDNILFVKALKIDILILFFSSYGRFEILFRRLSSNI